MANHDDLSTTGRYAAYGAVWTETLRRTTGDIHMAIDPAAATEHQPAPGPGDIARDADGHLWRYADQWQPALDAALVDLARTQTPHPAAPAAPLSLVIRAVVPTRSRVARLVAPGA